MEGIGEETEVAHLKSELLLQGWISMDACTYIQIMKSNLVLLFTM